MIICGYSGIGKTTYCKTHANCVDLDSSAFCKRNGWEADYLRVAQQLSMTGKQVFISAHPAVIRYCQSNNIPFTLVIPGEAKAVWEARLKLRYEQCHKQYAFNALQDFYLNYDRDMEFYSTLKNVKIQRVTCKVVTSLALD